MFVYPRDTLYFANIFLLSLYFLNKVFQTRYVPLFFSKCLTSNSTFSKLSNRRSESFVYGQFSALRPPSTSLSPRLYYGTEEKDISTHITWWSFGGRKSVAVPILCNCTEIGLGPNAIRRRSLRDKTPDSGGNRGL